jgi:hypothetical protein
MQGRHRSIAVSDAGSSRQLRLSIREERLMTEDQMRAYLRQWINGDFQGWRVAELRREVELLTSADEIGRWLAHAADIGIDPL